MNKAGYKIGAAFFSMVAVLAVAVVKVDPKPDVLPADLNELLTL